MTEPLDLNIHAARRLAEDGQIVSFVPAEYEGQQMNYYNNTEQAAKATLGKTNNTLAAIKADIPINELPKRPEKSTITVELDVGIKRLISEAEKTYGNTVELKTRLIEDENEDLVDAAPLVTAKGLIERTQAVAHTYYTGAALLSGAKPPEKIHPLAELKIDHQTDNIAVNLGRIGNAFETISKSIEKLVKNKTVEAEEALGDSLKSLFEKEISNTLKNLNPEAKR